jgi:SAM-dependent methyltransferase
VIDVFGPAYADAYDALYLDKDYGAECDLLERLFAKYAGAPVRSVLDLGCGTGNHALPLAARGFEVVGVDRSPGMVGHAREKATAAAAAGRVEFREGDLRSLRLERRFDAALMMFAVLGYQLENAHVRAALESARAHLEPGGLFLFDVWYGPAVLRERPSSRVKEIATDRGRIQRETSGELDVRSHTCTVAYRLRPLDQPEAAETRETHTVRYFFPRELELFLEIEGFELERLGALPDFEREPDETSWNVMGVARAV